MADVLFNNEDIEQINRRGMNLESVVSQVERFKVGFPYSRLRRPCTVGDGIVSLRPSDIKRYVESYTESGLSRSAMKFVPASGAATRMVKSLLHVSNNHENLSEKDILSETEKGNPDFLSVLRCMRHIKQFAYYKNLEAVMSRDGMNIETLISQKSYKPILEYTLTSKGLNFANLPKGLIPFHRYDDQSRTPFEEHVVEGMAYVQDAKKLVRIHFTVSSDHEGAVREHLEKTRNLYEKGGIKCDLSFSVQKTSSDTLAVDPDNRPLRDNNGNLLFRPGGHGALLENLSDLEGDIIFIKNIDNVVPDRLKPETVRYKKALGGYLIELQQRISEHLLLLSDGRIHEETLREILDDVRQQLFIFIPDHIKTGTKEEKIRFLQEKLNRPLRLCGMVKNEGEPGGGPFWVEGPGEDLSLQIVESSQVDMASSKQRSIWESSTHFNPVDLVCGVRDHQGRPYDLQRFTDLDTGFISTKSHEGRKLKALELPGLWNGAMARWNTVFVEVPVITFNPVKTMLDLLREEHQPG